MTLFYFREKAEEKKTAAFLNCNLTSDIFEKQIIFAFTIGFLFFAIVAFVQT